MRRVFSGIVLAGAVLAALAGCGPQAPETVEVTLTDFGIESSTSTFRVGQPYQFVITNEGTLNHEFVIMRPLTEGEMGMPGHGMEEALVEVTEDELPPGATVTVEYTFTEPMSAGSVEFACHLSGHYEAGMRMPLTVEQ